jgi:TolB-like protein
MEMGPEDPVPTQTEAEAPDQGGQEDERPGLAVWPFTNGGSFGSEPWDYDALEVGLQQMLITELAQNSELRLINRGRIREIIEELELGQTAYVAPGTTAQVGRLVGARYMIVGNFVDANGTMRLDARVDNVETGEILNETAAKVQDDRENVLAMVVDLAVKVVESVDLPALAQEVVEERRSTDLSGESVMLYSLALTEEDLGNREAAIELYRRVISASPEYTPARERLVQLGG